MLRDDPLLSALIEPLRAIMGYSQPPAVASAGGASGGASGGLVSAEHLCSLVKAICATTDLIDVFAWCKRGIVPRGRLPSLPLCGHEGGSVRVKGGKGGGGGAYTRDAPAIATRANKQRPRLVMSMSASALAMLAVFLAARQRGVLVAMAYTGVPSSGGFGDSGEA